MDSRFKVINPCISIFFKEEFEFFFMSAKVLKELKTVGDQLETSEKKVRH